MSSLTLLALFASVFGAYGARMPEELSKMLGIGDDSKRDTQSALSALQEDLKKEPGTFMGSDFDLTKYLAQSPSNMATIEAARRNLGAGNVEMYMPPKIDTVECHVEFQVTERVPGRCIQLGRKIPACQAEKYIGINYHECP